LEHIDVKTMVGDRESIRHKLDRVAAAGFCEVMYTPSGPDVARELRTYAAAYHPESHAS
jgi:5,10-methylenetetrahydromethanopterin reductase